MVEKKQAKHGLAMKKLANAVGGLNLYVFKNCRLLEKTGTCE